MLALALHGVGHDTPVLPEEHGNQEAAYQLLEAANTDALSGAQRRPSCMQHSHAAHECFHEWHTDTMLAVHSLLPLPDYITRARPAHPLSLCTYVVCCVPARAGGPLATVCPTSPIAAERALAGHKEHLAHHKEVTRRSSRLRVGSLPNSPRAASPGRNEEGLGV